MLEIGLALSIRAAVGGGKDVAFVFVQSDLDIILDDHTKIFPTNHIQLLTPITDLFDSESMSRDVETFAQRSSFALTTCYDPLQPSPTILAGRPGSLSLSE